MTLPLLKKLRITQRRTLHSTHSDRQASGPICWISGLSRWGATCAWTAVMASTLMAAEPASSSKEVTQRRMPGWFQQEPAPETRATKGIKSRMVVPMFVKNSTDTDSPSARTAAPQPLEMPLSTFDRGRSTPESRIARTAGVKSTSSPAAAAFFESADSSGGTSTMITLPDFLKPTALAQADGVSSLLPPEPIADTTQLIVPESASAAEADEIDTVFRPISQIQPYYAYSPTGKRPGEYLCPQPSSIPDDERARCPEIQPLPAGGSTDRNFAMVDYHWFAADLKHKPLYFEDVALERYGQQYPYGIQPFVSIARFGIQGIGLPYQMALDPVHRDIYALGYYRPGDCAPELEYQVPLNLKAAAAAGGVYTGLIFLFP